MNQQPHHTPPTLPPPRAWRLLVAAIVIAGFLYLMYRTGEKEEQVTPPAGQGSLSGVTAAAA